MAGDAFQASVNTGAALCASNPSTLPVHPLQRNLIIQMASQPVIIYKFQPIKTPNGTSYTKIQLSYGSLGLYLSARQELSRTTNSLISSKRKRKFFTCPPWAKRTHLARFPIVQLLLTTPLYKIYPTLIEPIAPRAYYKWRDKSGISWLSGYCRTWTHKYFLMHQAITKLIKRI